jgi:hypothetical protein
VSGNPNSEAVTFGNRDSDKACLSVEIISGSVNK